MKDNRVKRAIADYMLQEELGSVEGAIVLKFDRADVDCFYLGYMVYRPDSLIAPPSYYTYVNGKMVVVYTGIERYLHYTEANYKDWFKEAEDVFAQKGSGLIVEPMYWQFSLTDDGYKKKILRQVDLNTKSLRWLVE